MLAQNGEQNSMSILNDLPESVKQALLNDPAQTVPPASILLEQVPNPNPDLPKNDKHF